jgi:hypothetical protein
MPSEADPDLLTRPLSPNSESRHQRMWSLGQVTVFFAGEVVIATICQSTGAVVMGGHRGGSLLVSLRRFVVIPRRHLEEFSGQLTPCHLTHLSQHGTRRVTRSEDLGLAGPASLQTLGGRCVRQHMILLAHPWNSHVLQMPGQA